MNFPGKITTNQQIEILEKNGKMCHLVERELHHFPMCLTCALTRRTDVLKALFRYDSVDNKLICNECMGHQNVVHVNMLGRILYVRDKVLILCDRCLRPRHWDTPCYCTVDDVPPSNTCCVCNNANTISSKEVVNIKLFKMRTMHFCYRHSLSCVINNATVYDVLALEQELKNKAIKTNGKG